MTEGQPVYDTHKPSRRGVIVRPGVQVSEVKWDQDGGRTSYVPNNHLEEKSV